MTDGSLVIHIIFNLQNIFYGQFIYKTMYLLDFKFGWCQRDTLLAKSDLPFASFSISCTKSNESSQYMDGTIGFECYAFPTGATPFCVLRITTCRLKSTTRLVFRHYPNCCQSWFWEEKKSSTNNWNHYFRRVPSITRRLFKNKVSGRRRLHVYHGLPAAVNVK